MAFSTVFTASVDDTSVAEKEKQGGEIFFLAEGFQRQFEDDPISPNRIVSVTTVHVPADGRLKNDHQNGSSVPGLDSHLTIVYHNRQQTKSSYQPEIITVSMSPLPFLFASLPFIPL